MYNADVLLFNNGHNAGTFSMLASCNQQNEKIVINNDRNGC